MIVGLYSSVTGKETGGQNLEIISRNLANINTAGFKKNMPTFRTFMDNGESIHGTTISKVFIDHSQGTLKPTGNKLDMAINGKGYFVLESENGKRYSRNGHFLINKDMEIINSVGWKVLDDNGQTLEVPQNVKEILVNGEGEITVDGVGIGKVDVVDFANKEVLKEVGNSAYIAQSGNSGETSTSYEVQQGFVESSNVSVVDEMVNMIANSRSFEGNSRINKTFDRTLEKLVSAADGG